MMYFFNDATHVENPKTLNFMQNKHLLLKFI